jgi:alpha-amylase
VASIHDRVVFKQEGLDQRLHYDSHLRNSLIDHFYDLETDVHAVSRGEAEERGDFVHGVYETRVRRNPERIQIQLARHGSVSGIPIKITKGVTAEAGSSTLEIAYLLEGLPEDRPLRFGVEFNFAGLPSYADDRYFYRGDHEQLGQLQTRLELDNAADLSLVDRWLGIDLRMVANQATQWWTYPVETVSQSEGGFELVHQSVVVQPHWLVRGDSRGRWSVTLHLEIDTSLAESRLHNPAEAAVS